MSCQMWAILNVLSPTPLIPSSVSMRTWWLLLQKNDRTAVIFMETTSSVCVFDGKAYGWNLRSASMMASMLRFQSSSMVLSSGCASK